MLETSKEQPKIVQVRKVRWGWWIALSVFVVFLAALWLLPATPLVREWVLGYAKHYVEQAGYTLDYQESYGNLWSGVKLEGVHLRGQGQDVAIQSLGLKYFVPSLITGELPLSIQAKGLSGQINFKSLDLGATPSSGSTLPIRITLKDIDLEDIAVAATDVPFSLPNFSLGNLQIQSRGQLLHFLTTVSTLEGSADIEGDLGLSPFRLKADVSRADIRIARQWWEGIEGGSVSGTLSVENGVVRSQAKVVDGQIHFMNEVVTGISGDATLDYPQVRATLNGQTLGGTIQARGGVDIDKSNWFSDFSGDVDLKETAVWLATGRLPIDLNTWPITGRAQTQATASGWVDVAIQGKATANGMIASWPLTDLKGDYRIDREGVNVTATALLAQGPLEATFKPEDEGIVFDLNVQNAQILPFAQADGEITIRSQPGVEGQGITKGESTIDLAGNVWGRDFALTSAGVIDVDGWQNVVTGISSKREIIEGAWVLNEKLEGQINIKDVVIPGASELLELSVAASGPAPALPLTLSIVSPPSFDMDILGVKIPIQGGQVTGVLETIDLKDIKGNIGPINLQGALSLNGKDADLTLSAADIPLSGRVTTELNIPTGRFVMQEGNITTDLQIQTTEVLTSGITLAPISGNATVTFEGLSENSGLSATIASPTLDVDYQNGEVQATFKNTEITAQKQTFVVNGSSQLQSNDLATLSADLNASSSLGQITLQGQDGQLSFHAVRQDEFPLDVQGNLNVPQNSLDFSGTLMDASVSGTAALKSNEIAADVLVERGDEALAVTVTGSLQNPELSAKGSLPADVLEPILNIPLSGSLQVDMTRRAGEFEGSARLEGSVSNVPVDLQLLGQGNSLVLSGTARPYGQALDVNGTIDLLADQPLVNITAQGDIGIFQLSQGEQGFILQGQGITPELNTGGINLSGQAWKLSGPINDLSLKVGDSEIVIRQDGGLSASGNVRQSATFAGAEFILTALTTITPDSSSIDGTLTINTPTQQTVLPISGSLDALNVGGTISAQELATLAKLPLQVAGDITLNGTLSLTGQPNYDLQGVWQAGESSLALQVTGEGNQFQVSAQNDTLTATYSPTGLELSANGFDPGPYLLSPDIAGSATGQLQRLQGQWSGSMAYQSLVPVQASLTINGLGDTLGLSVDYANQGFSAHVTGEVFPDVSLAVEAHYQDLATLNGQLSGTLSQPSLVGVLTTKEITQPAISLFVPAQQFVVKNEGLKIFLENEGSSFSVSQSQLEGQVEVPFRLKGQLHSLNLLLSGAPTLPTATGELKGDVLQGSLKFVENQFDASVSLNANPWLQDISLGVPLTSEPLTITFKADTDLNWQADVFGKGQLDKLPVGVSASFTGQGLNYQADAGLRLNEQTLPIKLLGEGKNIQARADFDYFSLDFLQPYIQSQGQMRGYVQFDNRQAQPLEMNISAEGQVAAQRFSLTSELSQEKPLRINVGLGNASVLIEPKTAKLYEFTVAMPELRYPFLLKGAVDIAETIDVRAEGQVDLEPVSLEAEFTPATFKGQWIARLVDSTFQGSLERLEDALVLQSQLELLPNSLIPVPVSAKLRAISTDNIWAIERLDAFSVVNTQPLKVQLSGQAFPKTDIAGTLELDNFAPLSLHLQRGEGYQLDLTQDALILSTRWSSLTRLESARLQGEGQLLSVASVSGDLSWQREGGFTGELGLDASFLSESDFPLKTHFNLIGQGSLEVSGSVSAKNISVGTVGLSLPVDVSSLAGRILVDTDLAQLFANDQHLFLKSDIEVSGTPLHPGLVGQVKVSGVVNAQGQLSFSDVFREQGRLELSGDVQLVSELGLNGYHVDATTKDLDLSSLLPYLSLPRLTTNVKASQAPGQTPVIQADASFALEHSQLSAQFNYDGGWQGQINVNADLADLRVASLPLQGTIKGTINLEDSSLNSNLAVNQLRWGDGAASLDGTVLDGTVLDGTVLVTGSLASPAVTAKLSGAGSASGELLLNLENQVITLSSNLRSGLFSSDINGVLGQNMAQAQGFINFNNYQLAFVASESPSVITAVGQEKLLGWQLSADVVQKRLMVNGDLASLQNNLRGVSQLSLNWLNLDSEDWLSGTLTDLSISGVALGNLDLSSSPGFVHIDGESLNADVDIKNQSWKVDRLYLPSNNATLDLTGSGTLSTANLKGTLQSSWLDANISSSASVPVSLDYAKGVLALQSQGDLPSGHVDISVQGRPEVGWQGVVNLQTVTQGIQVDIQGSIEGAFTSPEVILNTVVSRGDIRASGTVRAGLESVSLEQNVSAPQLDSPLRLTGSVVPLDLKINSNAQVLHLTMQDGKLITEGNLELSLGSIKVQLNSNPEGLELLLKSGLTGLNFATTFSSLSFRELTKSLQQGIALQGQDATSGSVVLSLQDKLRVQFEALRYESALGLLELSGGLSQAGGWQGQVSGTWQGTGKDSEWLPWLSSLRRVDFNLLLEEKDAALIVQSEAGGLTATLNRDSSEALLKADIALGSGRVTAYISYNQLGPAGEIKFTDVPLYRELTLTSSLTLDPTAVGGRAQVAVGKGRISLEGSLGLKTFLPSALVPQGGSGRQLNLRIDTVDVQALPYIKGRAPYLVAHLSGVARLQGSQWVGQVLSPELTVFENSLPLDLEFNGATTDLELRGTLGRSTFNANLDPSHVEGLLSFQQFPIQSIAEAFAGETGVQGVLWGALRFDVPLANVRQSYLSFASEKLVLGQNERETQGQLSFHSEEGGLVIDQAEFEGDGSWQATGQLTTKLMDFQISAREADFTPLLSLFPQLAALGFGASGSLELSAKGSFSEPQVLVVSPSLDIVIGGSSYRLQDALINLKQGQLSTQAQLLGLKPIGGSLTLAGEGQAQLNPAQASIKLKATGSANIPALGNVEDIDATITGTPGVPWEIDLTGRLGDVFQIKGSLIPLDVTLKGQALNLRAPDNFLDSSSADVDMRLRYDNGSILSGAINASQVAIKIATRDAAAPSPDAVEQTSPDAAIQTSPDAAAQTSRNRFLDQFRFDSIFIKAPQQVTFNENFGDAELGFDVILTGTAAQAELSGEARSLRGNLNFAGRTFRIESAIASFQPSRGIYPSLSILATTSVEKIQAVRGNTEIEFIEPAGQSFEVFLNFSGDLSAKEGGGFSANLEPTLSSNAIISTPAGERPLTENELYSLITLKQLQLAETITGQGSVAESVAQGALDTAVDYYILSELQNQLGEALGLDLFEVRTTALSSLLAGSQSFGVALRIGGYLRDDLFASYEIRTLDLEPDIAFSNEFSLRYDFSPVELDLVGRLNILRQATFTPVPELSIGLGYVISPLFRVQGAVDISQQEQSVRFGVGVRW